ncbi:MAG: hypothetical protein K940chlam9_00187 [Chlamydiae bacterium]|nr:hypothetical protein [Chlamydiota bacterium]
MGGCSRAPLECRTEYLRPDYLASWQISTPDPCLDCFYGEQIVVRWDLPRRDVEATLLLHLRYGNRETETVMRSLHTPKGYWTYRLVNDPYWCKEGILSYRAEIWQNGELLTDWTHHLYTELIEFSD